MAKDEERTMTKLSPHRCDLCGEIIYKEENVIHTLERDRETDGILHWELCATCDDKFLEWIKKQYKEIEQ